MIKNWRIESMNKPRVTTFKSLAKRMKVQKKKVKVNKTQKEKDDFDRAFDEMCRDATQYWGY